MRSLSHEIELYLKQLLAEQEAGMLVIQRSVLSELFSCVPSQINYVLSTRFTLANGYLVESRRGGGGYVRIISVPLENEDDMSVLREKIGVTLSAAESDGLLQYLHEEAFLSADTAQLLKHLMKDGVLKFPPQATLGEIRAHMMKHLLAVLSIQHTKHEEDK